jgi:RimJ/RimL family protein N-acetyltransferase
MLSGQFVYLRAIERNDLNLLLSWRNKPEFRRFFREYRELNTDQQLSWYESKVLSDPTTRMFAIVDQENDDIIGACGLCYIDWINRSADFSIYIGAQNLYIDDQYAPDVGRILIRYGFRELNLHRLWAEIYEFDQKKIDLFELLGFHLDGKHLQTHWTEGRWCNSLFFGLISSHENLLGEEFNRKN